MRKIAPDKEYLDQCFSYCESTGKLIWKTRPMEHFQSESAKKTTNTAKAGTYAGTIDKRGNLRVKLCGKCYFVHTIVYKLAYGIDVPEGNILRHKDGNFGNNRLGNLVLGTLSDRRRINLSQRDIVGKFKKNPALGGALIC